MELNNKDAQPPKMACNTRISLLHLANRLLKAQTRIQGEKGSILHHKRKAPPDQEQSPSDAGNDNEGLGSEESPGAIGKVKRRLWDHCGKNAKLPIRTDTKSAIGECHVNGFKSASLTSILQTTSQELTDNNGHQNSSPPILSVDANQNQTSKLAKRTPQNVCKSQKTKQNAIWSVPVDNNSLQNLGGKIAKKYQCSRCSYETDNRSHLRRHENCKHNDYKPFYCYLCFQDFARSEKVRAHFQKDHCGVIYDPNKVRKNPSPSFADTPREPPRISMMDTEPANNYENSLPASPTLIKETLRKSESPDSVKSATAEGSPGAFGLKRHHCPECNYAGKDSWHLKRHISEVHKGEKEFKCAKCSYATSRKHRIISHMKGHGELVCFYCTYQTEDVDTFQGHLKVCSKQRKPKRFVCDFCDRAFLTQRSLINHIQTTHPSIGETMAIPCTNCDYTSSDPDTFKQHLKECSKHQKPKRYICDFCDKGFDSHKAYITHMEDAHVCLLSASMINKCKYCSFTTVNKETLRQHELGHTEDKPLMNRYTTVPGSSAFECAYDHCSFNTPWKSELEKHMSQSHGDCESKADSLPGDSSTSSSITGHDTPGQGSPKYDVETKLDEVQTFSCYHEGCDYRTKALDDLEAHEAACLYMIGECGQVNDSCSSDQSETEDHICSVCGDVFESVQELNDHIAEEHSSE